MYYSGTFNSIKPLPPWNQFAQKNTDHVITDSSVSENTPKVEVHIVPVPEESCTGQQANLRGFTVALLSSLSVTCS